MVCRPYDVRACGMLDIVYEACKIEAIIAKV